MGSHQKITEYERRRDENIKRNSEMLAALKIKSKLVDLAAVSAKRERAQCKTYKRSPVKKPKIETPVVLRRSLRTRGVPPDASTAGGIIDDLDKKLVSTRKSKSAPRKSPQEQGPLAMRDLCTCDDELDQKLIEIISACSRKFISGEADAHPCDNLDNSENFEAFKAINRLHCSIDVEALQLKSENIARVVPGRIMSLRIFPSLDMQMIAVGNKFGDIGFWNVNGKQEDGDGIFLYHPHTAPVSGFVINPFSVSKMYSSCYDGSIRLMDVEKEVFDMVYSSEYSIYSISQSTHDVKSLYFGEGIGGINMWDVRAGKSSFSCDLHEYRINTIDFNSDNEYIMATSSTDGTACIWDLRQINADKPAPLKTVTHKRAVASAYFSPSGKCLATTSADDKVSISSGANYEDTCMVYHNNQTGRWISPFRGIWGWDDSSIFIGNMKRGVDVISVEAERIVATLESDLLSAIPCRFDAHPYNDGMLAGATSGGQVYVWALP
ncbi:hypothetical protein ACS0TY_021164 [Phlomoides rotata]